MQLQTQHSEFQGWQRLVGRWATEATHPAFPGTVVSGQNPGLAAMAREVINANQYLVLATADQHGVPWVSW